MFPIEKIEWYITEFIVNQPVGSLLSRETILHQMIDYWKLPNPRRNEGKHINYQTPRQKISIIMNNLNGWEGIRKNCNGSRYGQIWKRIK